MTKLCPCGQPAIFEFMQVGSQGVLCQACKDAYFARIRSWGGKIGKCITTVDGWNSYKMILPATMGPTYDWFLRSLSYQPTQYPRVN